jgi:hypothetical protein
MMERLSENKVSENKVLFHFFIILFLRRKRKKEDEKKKDADLFFCFFLFKGQL